MQPDEHRRRPPSFQPTTQDACDLLENTFGLTLEERDYLLQRPGALAEYAKTLYKFQQTFWTWQQGWVFDYIFELMTMNEEFGILPPAEWDALVHNLRNRYTDAWNRGLPRIPNLFLQYHHQDPGML